MDWVGNGGTEIVGFMDGLISGKAFISQKINRFFLPTKSPNLFLVFEDELDVLPDGLIEVNPKPLFTYKGQKYKKYKYLWSFY